jgi:hypothetical protein
LRTQRLGAIAFDHFHLPVIRPCSSGLQPLNHDPVADGYCRHSVHRFLRDVLRIDVVVLRPEQRQDAGLATDTCGLKDQEGVAT